jgi:hypothetical protein
MKSRLLPAVAVLVAAGAALWWMLGREKGLTIRITQQQIDQALAEKFPKRKNYLVILQATFFNPRAELLPDQDKVRLGADVEVTLLGLKEEEALTGSLDVLTRVRYEPRTHGFFLDEPVIESFVIDDLPAKYLNILSNQALALAREEVETTPLHTLEADESEQVAAGLLLREIDIRPDAIHITLGL